MKMQTPLRALMYKELLHILSSPLTYVVVAGVFSIAQWLFWNDFFLRNMVSNSAFISLLSWFLVILVPALTMRTFAEERKTGTFESLATSPLPLHHLVIGKFLAVMLFLALALLTTVGAPLSLSYLGQLDWGEVAAGFMTALALAGILTSVGLCISASTTNQIGAFLATAIVGFILTIMGSPLVTSETNGVIGDALRLLGTSRAVEEGSRGMITLYTALYFVSIPMLTLYLTTVVLRYRDADIIRRTKFARPIHIALASTLLVLALLVAQSTRGHVDLTSTRKNTINPKSIEIIRDIPDIVTIRTFFSQKLPPQQMAVRDNTLSLLRSLEQSGDGKLILDHALIGDPQEEEKNARALGVPLIQFNNVERDQAKIQNGFLGLVVQYRDKIESIPYIESPGTVEYELMRAVTKVTAQKQSLIGIIGGDSTEQGNYGTISQLLNDQYQTMPLSMESLTSIPETITAAVVLGNTTATKEQGYVVDQFLTRGVGVLLMVNNQNVGQTLTASPAPYTFEPMLDHLGITLKKGFVVDEVNALAPFNTGYTTVVTPYPYWVKTGTNGINQEHSITARIPQIVVPWTSALTLSGENTKPLISSSEKSAVVSEGTSLFPNEEFSFPIERKQEIIAAVFHGPYSSAFSASDKPESIESEFKASSETTRAVVIASQEFVRDGIVQQFEGNRLFFYNAIDFLTQDERLSAIRTKTSLSSPITTSTTAEQQQAYKYGNTIAPILLFMTLMGLLQWRRKRQGYTLSSR